MTVKRCLDSTVQANFYVNNISDKFLNDVIKVPRREFLYRFEAFAITGLAGNSTSLTVLNSNNRKVALKKAIWENLTKQLSIYPCSICLVDNTNKVFFQGELTEKENVIMPWKTYGEFIQKYNVRLLNWPLHEIGPIDNLNESMLEQIRDSIESGICRWEKTNATISNDAPLPRKRKERSDKGTKRTSKRQHIETDVSAWTGIVYWYLTTSCSRNLCIYIN